MDAMLLGVGEGAWAQWAVDALVVPVPESREAWLPELIALNEAMGGAIELAREDGFEAAAGECCLLYPAPGTQARRVLLVGLQKEGLNAVEAYRQAVGHGVKALEGQATSLGILPVGGLSPAEVAQAAAEAATLASTRKDFFVSKPDPKAKHVAKLWVASDLEAAERGARLARQVAWVRRLSDLPGLSLTPPLFVAEIEKAASAVGAAVEVLDHAAVKREGLMLLDAVGKASIHPPALVIVRHDGGQAGDAPHLIVGKGITFDTGGICIKPRAGMEEMKTDMHGAAAAVATVLAARERQLPLNLVAVVAIAENMPDGHASRPGDVVQSHQGLKVEIIDTDAEGRLILADALSYGVSRFKPSVVVDMATLTGSVIMALAYAATGLFTRNLALSAELRAAGELVDEKLWPLPMFEGFESAIKSEIADVKNSAKEKGDASHAAIFLQRFVGDVPFAHLDVAGPSYLPEGRHYLPKGSTGTGVRTLITWLEQRASTSAQA